MHASVRRVLRQAWEMDDAERAETLIRNLARRLEPDWNGVSASILEGIDEMLTVTRLGLPRELRRSLACTNIIENVMGTVRRVCRNVKYWRSPSMALRWAAAAMQEATKGLPSIEGIQASAGSSRCSCKARPTAAFPRGACSNRRGCANLNAQRPLREFQQTAGHPPGPSPTALRPQITRRSARHSCRKVRAPASDVSHPSTPR